jgi:heparan-sulfate lyase
MIQGLMAKLNLDYPGLEAVKEACAAGSWDEAGERLLAYYLGKRQERCLDFWDMTGPEDYQQMPWGAASTPEQLWKNTPEDVAQGLLFASGHVFDFRRDEDIDWRSDIFLWADGAKYPYAQARLLLRRMYWLRPLDLYYLRGDEQAQERAARQFVRLLESWWAQPAQETYAVNEAISLGDTVPQSGLTRSWYVFLPSPHIGNEFKLRLLHYIVDLAAYVQERALWKPWALGLSCGNAMGYVGMLFPELKQAEEWRARCFAYMNHVLGEALRPDGTLDAMDFVPHYQGGAAAIVFAFLPQTARLGYRELLTPQAQAGLEKMGDWLVDVQKPDNTVPQLCASDEQGFNRWLELAARWCGRADWLYVATAGREGLLPEHTSRALPDGGAFVLRDGWGTDAMYACLHNGDQHNVERNSLAMDLYALGRTLVTAQGRYGYCRPEWPRYFTTVGYNTLMVDGTMQTEWGKNHPLQNGPDLARNYWRFGQDVDFVWASHPSGFVAAPDVRWQRGLLFVKGEYWLVLDYVTGEGEHDLDLRWLLTPSETVIEPDGLIVHTNNADANVRIVPLWPDPPSPCPSPSAGGGDDESGGPANSGPLPLRWGRARVRVDGAPCLSLWRGSDKPLRGWYSPENGYRIPAPQLEYTWRSALPALVATLIVPYRGTVPAVTAHLATAGAECWELGLSWADGRQDRLDLDLSGGGRVSGERHRSGQPGSSIRARQVRLTWPE